MPKFAPITRFPLVLLGRARPFGDNRNPEEFWSPSGRVDARIGLEPRRRDAGDGALFVVVGGIPGNADRPDDVAGPVTDQDAAGNRHEPSVAGGGERREEHLRARYAARQGARSEAHAQRPPGFTEGYLKTQDAGFVLALEGHQVTAGIQHGNRERRKFGVAPGLERDIENGAGLRERER